VDPEDRGQREEDAGPDPGQVYLVPVLPEAAKKEGVRACKPCAPGLKTAPGKTNRRPKAGGLDERHAPLRPWR